MGYFTKKLSRGVASPPASPLSTTSSLQSPSALRSPSLSGTPRRASTVSFKEPVSTISQDTPPTSDAGSEHGRDIFEEEVEGEDNGWTGLIASTACVPDDEYDSRTSEAWARRMVLSLDGGGIQSLAELYILKILMRRVAELENAEEDKFSSSAESPLNRECFKEMEGLFLPCHYFDYIGGTSITGGVIAIMLGRLRLTVDEAIQNYSRIWQAMGDKSRTFDTLTPKALQKGAHMRGLQSGLEAILSERKDRLRKNVTDTQSHIREGIKSNSQMCRTLVIALESNKKDTTYKDRPFVFRSYEKDNDSSKRRPSMPKRETLISEVALATSAAPAFFENFAFDDESARFRDGSEWTPYVAWDVYLEVMSSHPQIEKPVGCLVSVGCDDLKRKRFGPSRSTGVNSRTTNDHQTAERFLKNLDQTDPRFQYHRLSAPSELIDVNWNDLKASPVQHFQRIEKRVEKHCKQPEVMAKINNCAHALVLRRHTRCKSSPWEAFAGLSYQCSLCANDLTQYDHRDDFVTHLQLIHGAPVRDGFWAAEVDRLVQKHANMSIM